jgi:hypothetical protein
MDEDRPRLNPLRKVEAFPPLPPIHAAIGAVVRPHVDHVGIGRVDGDGVHVNVVGEAFAEPLP